MAKRATRDGLAEAHYFFKRVYEQDQSAQDLCYGLGMKSPLVPLLFRCRGNASELNRALCVDLPLDSTPIEQRRRSLQQLANAFALNNFRRVFTADGVKFKCESDGVLFSTEEAALQHLLNNYAPEVETTLEALSCDNENDHMAFFLTKLCYPDVCYPDDIQKDAGELIGDGEFPSVLAPSFVDRCEVDEWKRPLSSLSKKKRKKVQATIAKMETTAKEFEEVENEVFFQNDLSNELLRYLDEPLYQEFYGKENEEEDEDEDEEEEEEDADITHDVQGEEENDAEGEEDHVIVSSDTSVETGSSSPPSSPSMRTNPNEQSPQEAEGEDGPGAEEEEQEEDVPVLTEEEKEENERRLQFLLSHGKAWCDELLLEIVDDVVGELCEKLGTRTLHMAEKKREQELRLEEERKLQAQKEQEEKLQQQRQEAKMVERKQRREQRRLEMERCGDALLEEVMAKEIRYIAGEVMQEVVAELKSRQLEDERRDRTDKMYVPYNYSYETPTYNPAMKHSSSSAKSPPSALSPLSPSSKLRRSVGSLSSSSAATEALPHGVFSSSINQSLSSSQHASAPRDAPVFTPSAAAAAVAAASSLSPPSMSIASDMYATSRKGRAASVDSRHVRLSPAEERNRVPIHPPDASPHRPAALTQILSNPLGLKEREDSVRRTDQEDCSDLRLGLSLLFSDETNQARFLSREQRKQALEVMKRDIFLAKRMDMEQLIVHGMPQLSNLADLTAIDMTAPSPPSLSTTTALTKSSSSSLLSSPSSSSNGNKLSQSRLKAAQQPKPSSATAATAERVHYSHTQHEDEEKKDPILHSVFPLFQKENIAHAFDRTSAEIVIHEPDILHNIPEEFGMESNLTLVLRNVPERCTKADIHRFFRGIPISVRKSPNFAAQIHFLTNNSGCVFVQFEDAKGVETALLKDNEHIVPGSAIRVSKPIGLCTSETGQKFSFNFMTRNLPVCYTHQSGLQVFSLIILQADPSNDDTSDTKTTTSNPLKPSSITTAITSPRASSSSTSSSPLSAAPSARLLPTHRLHRVGRGKTPSATRIGASAPSLSMVGGRGTLPSLGDSVPSLAPNPSATRADRRNVHSSSTKTTLSPRMHASTPTASSSTPHNTSLPVTIPRKAQQQPTSSVSPSPSTLSIPSLDLNTTSRDSSRTREGSSNSLRRPPGLSYPPQNESSLRQSWDGGEDRGGEASSPTSQYLMSRWGGPSSSPESPVRRDAIASAFVPQEPPRTTTAQSAPFLPPGIALEKHKLASSSSSASLSAKEAQDELDEEAAFMGRFL